MLIFHLMKTLDQLAVANGVYCFGHVLRMEDEDVLRMVLEFEGDDQK